MSQASRSRRPSQTSAALQASGVASLVGSHASRRSASVPDLHSERNAEPVQKKGSSKESQFPPFEAPYSAHLLPSPGTGAAVERLQRRRWMSTSSEYGSSLSPPSPDGKKSATSGKNPLDKDGTWVHENPFLASFKFRRPNGGIFYDISVAGKAMS
eukprot:gnl/MRDRNA2_/MRDRNA2_130438_c0_seq1.p1 gnl/MRDRNA2_/MRDRNA2_130438_c0~~gnl/MRDRNA2_/MRDRNA2_130438_c0_seq1.p1  ORF type:complete len:156 (-),score=24.50 gnl/MRDRNA2_/MRDRNA2_130438_c0_seq1:12-479(-)